MGWHQYEKKQQRTLTMLIVGLTGSIGMGKSTVAGCFRRRGVAVCDADQIVHDLYEGKAAPLVEAAFPNSTIEGKVDRSRLAQGLLSDPEGFRHLESIIHPLVQAEEREFLRAEFEHGASMAVLEVPLLFETGGNARMDATVVVSAPPEIQRQRLLARPGMTSEKLEALLARQLPDAEKRRRADFVVDTGVDIEESCTQVDTILQVLRARTGTAYSRYWS